MRKPVIAGNWKMNKGPKETAELIQELKPLAQGAEATVVVCVPAVSLAAAKEALKGSRIQLGAQNVHFMDSGAFTGELSAAMLREAGAQYVIVGHSERRQYFGETDETVNLRARAAIKGGLIPIICVGENKAQREAGYTDALVAYQTLIALSGMSAEEVRGVIVAYEPVWAIGTGLTATDEQANQTIAVIREAISGKYGKRVGNAVRILYGGSMNPKNSKGLMAQPEIDGGLIGGASLKAPDFARVIHYNQ